MTKDLPTSVKIARVCACETNNQVLLGLINLFNNAVCACVCQLLVHSYVEYPV